MIGNFYITIIKIFVVFSALIICYFFLAEHPLEYGKMMQLLAPLIVQFFSFRSHYWLAYKYLIILWTPLEW